MAHICPKCRYNTQVSERLKEHFEKTGHDRTTEKQKEYRGHIQTPRKKKEEK